MTTNSNPPRFVSLNLWEHKFQIIALILISLFCLLPYFQLKELIQFKDSYRWLLFDDAAWGELATSLSLLEKGEILWGYLYFDILQRGHALILTTLFMSAVIFVFGVYPGILVIHLIFLAMGALVPVLIYGTTYKIFGSKKAAFISGVVIASEPLILESSIYISRHPLSIFCFALSVFCCVVFLGKPKRQSVLWAVITGLFMGLACMADGDGPAVVAGFLITAIFYHFKLEKQKLLFVFLAFFIAVSMYFIPIVRNYINLGMAAPNHVAAAHLAHGNNDKIYKAAKRNETLFQETPVGWERDKVVWGHKIEKKFAENIFPEYEYHMMYSAFYKKWVTENPFKAIYIFAKRFFQKITIYHSWHSTFIAISALISLGFIWQYRVLILFPALAWLFSGLMFSLIYLTFWHQLHQIMLLSVLSGFGILRLSRLLSHNVTGKVFPTAPVSKCIQKWGVLLLVCFTIVGSSFFIKTSVMKDPKVKQSFNLLNHKLPILPDTRVKDDFALLKKRLKSDALVITKYNPFLVNKIIDRDVFLSYLGERFDGYAPKDLDNGWIIHESASRFYRFRRNVDYIHSSTNFIDDALNKGRTIITDFEPPKGNYVVLPFFRGEVISFYQLYRAEQFYSIDNNWRKAYEAIEDSPLVNRVSGKIKTSLDDYVFSIVDDLSAEVVFEFPLKETQKNRILYLDISTNASSPVDNFIQVSSDSYQWFDVELQMEGGHQRMLKKMPNCMGCTTLYLKVFQGNFSNMHIKKIQVSIAYDKGK